MISESSEIIQDISVFRDPATKFEIISGLSKIEVAFFRRGERLRYEIDRKSGSIQSRTGSGERFSSVASMLASEKFSNLSGLKATQRRMLGENFSEEMDPEGVISIAGGEREISLSLNEIKKVLQDKNPHFCILVDGPAGVGKTSLIRRLSREAAENLNDVPILHVTSKGRRLTNLRDAFSATINDLRADFFADELPVLVRYGLIIVALDGFDEFVDPSGYRDAWAALKDFFRNCIGGRPIVLSGRDTFFDQQRFKAQLESVSGGMDIAVARLSNVDINVAKSWLRKKGWSDQEVDSEETNAFFRTGSYTLRPFFIDRIAGLGSWQFARDHGRSPQSVLIEAMVDRESEILTGALNLPAGTISKALHRLFETIALDMVERESDSTPVAYLDFVAEFSFAGVLEPDGISRLQHSLGSLALLETSSDAADVRFPHSEIQNRFYAQALVNAIINDEPISLLGRVIMGMDRMEALLERIVALRSEEAKKFCLQLQFIQRNKSGPYLYKQNVDSIYIMGVVRDEFEVPGNQFVGLSAGDVKLAGKIRSISISDTNFSRLDIRECSLTAVKFSGCNVDTLVGGVSTEFGESAPSVGVIQEIKEGQSNSIRVPADIEQWVQSRKLDQLPVSILNLPLVKHFERILRRFEAQTFIRDVDKDEGSFLLKGQKGEKVKALLEEEGFLVTGHRDTSGRKAPFFSLKSADELFLRNYPSSGAVGKLHDRLIQEAKKLG